jgi:hypothetical protein
MRGFLRGVTARPGLMGFDSGPVMLSPNGESANIDAILRAAASLVFLT